MSLHSQIIIGYLSTVRLLLRKSIDNPPLVYLDSSVAESEIEKSNLFNCYYHLVFSAASTMPDISDMQEAPLNPLSCITIILSEVYQTLVSLDPNKALALITSL